MLKVVLVVAGFVYVRPSWICLFSGNQNVFSLH